jgi:hypothetical protein
MAIVASRSAGIAGARDPLVADAITSSVIDE